MEIKKFSVSPRLTNFVRCYYHIENPVDRSFRDLYFSDGCIEVVFSVGWNFYKDGKKEDWAKVIGQIIEPRQLEIQGKGRSFGIWFHPHTFSYFSDIPMVELNDRVLSWDTLFPDSFSEFVGSCLHENNLDKLVRGADDFLIRRLAGHRAKRVDAVLDSAIQYIFGQKDKPDLDRMASMLNVSHRYLQRAFLSRVGVSQKHLMRILRFQKVLQNLTQGDLADLTSIAYANDFYDQSHFIREFKAFTGVVPSRFDSLSLPINQHFISERLMA